MQSRDQGPSGRHGPPGLSPMQRAVREEGQRAADLVLALRLIPDQHGLRAMPTLRSVIWAQYMKFAILGKMAMLGLVVVAARSTRFKKHIS
jgi:hypothetical protein